MATPKKGVTTTPSVKYGQPKTPSKPPVQPPVASGQKPTGKGNNPNTKQG